ncbi:MAG: adenosylcobinamide-GDP ribazoletransferase [Pseudomonadaceae bacterium]|nr:adenosylcobinamide-GDP ribazoletransferase [Pseudomonadaceae bacterium]
MPAFLIALQFLTRLPISLPGMPAAAQVGRSLLSYPLVGLLIGAVLLLAQWALAGTPPLLQAALLLLLWVAITGGLHLDGLADSADAWAGGYGDRERTLAIMQDPRSGPIAVVVLLLLLLLKFAALATLLQAGQPLALLLAPWLARGLVPLLFLSTPYVRAGGLGAALAEHLPRRELPYWLAGHALLLLLLGGWAGLWTVLAALLLLVGLRQLMLQRLGGCTGDTAGALVELAEATTLLVFALQLSA